MRCASLCDSALAHPLCQLSSANDEDELADLAAELDADDMYAEFRAKRLEELQKQSRKAALGGRRRIAAIGELLLCFSPSSCVHSRRGAASTLESLFVFSLSLSLSAPTLLGFLFRRPDWTSEITNAPPEEYVLVHLMQEHISACGRVSSVRCAAENMISASAYARVSLSFIVLPKKICWGVGGKKGFRRRHL